jgi:hypothetical protein
MAAGDPFGERLTHIRSRGVVTSTGWKGRTSFCEQKEAKKLYSFWFRAPSTPREAAQKFFGSFFQKRTSSFP